MRLALELNTLYIIMFLHQTTTVSRAAISLMCCILSCSYIKPQLVYAAHSYHIVVYYHVPTSNHNCFYLGIISKLLYIIMFLHQTTTLIRMLTTLLQLYIIMFLHQTTTCCLFVLPDCTLYIIMFLHQTTTLTLLTLNHAVLYIIMFLHQTTTSLCYVHLSLSCILSCSYIKPQLQGCIRCWSGCCILSCSYIKPQLFLILSITILVVYYHVPTSNHNL